MDLQQSTRVAAAPGSGPHFWAGAPSATLAPDGTVVLAYRTRSGPDGPDAIVVAQSPDGIRFETAITLSRELFEARWVERPSIVHTGEEWRLFVPCASPSGPQWRIDALAAPNLTSLRNSSPRTVLDATDEYGFKDPVITVKDGSWHAWLCCHLMDTPGEEDRMVAGTATSDDGWNWSWQGIRLRGRPGEWDARGVRVTGALPNGDVFFDGRKSKEENWFERSSIATRTPRGDFVQRLDAEVTDVRYVEVLALPDGTTRLYFETRLPDESHELRTCIATSRV